MVLTSVFFMPYMLTSSSSKTHTYLTVIDMLLLMRFPCNAKHNTDVVDRVSDVEQQLLHFFGGG